MPARRKETKLKKQEAERKGYLERLDILVGVSVKVLLEATVEALLQRVVEAARALCGAKLGIAGRLYPDGTFTIQASSRAQSASACPAGQKFTMKRGGICRDLLRKGKPLRLTHDELITHPAWRRLPQDHAPLRGLLGVPLTGKDGRPNGFIMVSDKGEGDFMEEDIPLMIQLATIASLGLRNIEERENAEKRAAEAEEGRMILEALMEYVPEGISIASRPDGRVSMMSRFGKELLGSALEQIEKHRAEDYAAKLDFFLGNGSRRAGFMDMPMHRAIQNGEALIDQEMIFRRPDGKEVTFLCNAAPIRGKEGTVTGGIVVWQDITDRKAQQEELRRGRDELERRVQERTAELQKANRALELEIMEHEKTEAELRAANELLERVFSTTQLAIALMDKEFNFLQVNRAYAGADGRPEEFFLGKNHFALYPHAENEAIFRSVVAKGEAYTVHGKAFSYPDHPARGTTYWDWTLHPIRGPSGEVEEVLLCLANVTERVRAEEKLRKSEDQLRALSAKLLSAHEEERKLVAQDIHDSLGSSLAAVKFRLEEKLDAMAGNRPSAGMPLEEIVSMVKETIKEARRISSNLRPSVLDTMGILPTIHWLCREFREAHRGLRLEESLDIDEAQIPESLKTSMFRILQEALHNVAKHGRADSVCLSLSKRKGGIQLSIEDNGEGFDLRDVIARPAPTKGMGLSNMRERAELSGGSFSIMSSKGRGTTIRVSWPLPLKAS
jgi:PAS domain S-box-containing protein